MTVTILKGHAIGNNSTTARLNPDELSAFAGSILGYTDIGAGREKNQDAASAYCYAANNQKSVILSLSDGLGYYIHSELAAWEAVTLIPQYLGQGLDIQQACLQHHKKLVGGFPYLTKTAKKKGENSPESDRDHGATTYVMAKISGSSLQIASVGDSRAYVIRDRKILHVTRDQSLLELLISRGELARDPALLRRHPYRNVLLNSLGSPEPYFEYEIGGKIQKIKSGTPVLHEMTLKKNDAVFLASDGLFTNLAEQEIIAMLAESGWDQICKKISDRLHLVFKTGKTTSGEVANPDNYTFVLYRHGNS